MLTSYKITVNGTGYVDWASILPDNTAFMVYVEALSKYVQTSSAIPHAVCYASFMNSTTHTTISPSIHRNANQYLASPINNNYSANNEVLSTSISNRVPLYMPHRPTNNNFVIDYLQSTTDDIYVPSFYGVNIYYQLMFVPYVSKIPSCVSNKPTPFNVILNSVNGTVINTNSYIQYNYNWANHYNPNTNQKYHMTFFIQTMGMDVTASQPFTVNMSCLPQQNNFYVSSSTSGAQTSQIIGNAYGFDYTTLSNYMGGPTTNSPISVTLPGQNVFDIQLHALGSTTLFAPTTGAMQDYQLILHFDPY